MLSVTCIEVCVVRIDGKGGCGTVVFAVIMVSGRMLYVINTDVGLNYVVIISTAAVKFTSDWILLFWFVLVGGYCLLFPYDSLCIVDSVCTIVEAGLLYYALACLL